jgi:sugar transferase EpsL
MVDKKYLFLKRGLDAGISLCLLVLLGPLLGVVSGVSLVAQGRPILFSQVRPGLQGRPFTIYKFRTMAQDASESGAGTEAERITGFGRLLRKLSLDELPQLWNVIRGDMSLIGPRPLLMEYLPLYNSRQSRRHSVRPGLTGLAQARGRNLLSWEERLELDAHYVESVSLTTDLRIFLWTLSTVTQGRGTTPQGSDVMEKFRGSFD